MEEKGKHIKTIARRKALNERKNRGIQGTLKIYSIEWLDRLA